MGNIVQDSMEKESCLKNAVQIKQSVLSSDDG